jgi:hypothetical protein
MKKMEVCFYCLQIGVKIKYNNISVGKKGGSACKLHACIPLAEIVFLLFVYTSNKGIRKVPQL